MDGGPSGQLGRGSPNNQAHLSSVALGDVLRQEMNFCDVRFFVVSSRPQRYAVKFYFKLGKSASETFELIKQAYGDDKGSQQYSGNRLPAGF